MYAQQAKLPHRLAKTLTNNNKKSIHPSSLLHRSFHAQPGGAHLSKSQPYQSINPTTGKLIKSYNFLSAQKLDECATKSHVAFEQYRHTSIQDRKKWLLQLAQALDDNKHEYARIMTEEMGKTIVSAVQEVEKCAMNCRYYANHGGDMLRDEWVDEHSRITYLPMGPILQIAPFNFPFWQVIRFAAPALMAGNTIMVRHSHCTPNSAQALHELFTQRTSFPTNVYTNLFADNEGVAQVIADPRVRGVTFTGSTQTGRIIAELSGAYLKKHVLELGGSDAFIVLADADIDAAVETAVASRTMNSGQSCIAAKRFIVENSVYDEFVFKFSSALKQLKVGDPMLHETQIGPMARKDLRDKLHEQVQEAVNEGAKLVVGGHIPQLTDFLAGGDGFFYSPTLLSEVDVSNVAFREELFGPVASVVRCENVAHAVRLANMSEYGLGSTIFTRDQKKAEYACRQLDTGMTFVNGICRSSPNLPFGGQKNSGYGRECGLQGLREWTNIKTVWNKDTGLRDIDQVE